MKTLKDIPHFSITSPKGKQKYFEPLEYYKEFGDSIPVKRKNPSIDEAIEYMELLKEERHGERWKQINGWRLIFELYRKDWFLHQLHSNKDREHYQSLVRWPYLMV